MKVKLIIMGLLLGFFVGGCTTVKVAQLTDEEIQERIEQDLVNMFEAQEPVIKPITLQEAIARVLKYNLDRRVKLMEIAVSQRIHELTNYNMLPMLALDAGYNSRSNYSGGSSQSLLTGRESLEASTSQERQYHTVALNLVWNVLDFGISHISAKQKANDVMIARERLRRVSQNVIRDVHDAFWRAVAAQKLLESVNSLLKEAQLARENSRILEKQRLQNPEIALNYQKRLLGTVRQLLNLQEGLILAKEQLAALINLPPGTRYKIAIPDDDDKLPELAVSLKELERLTLIQQPELLSEDYTQRINKLEVKKAFLRMFPGLEISFGAETNSNKFLYNKDWLHAGLRVTWNLLNVFTGGPAAKREAESHVVLSNHRRMALTMAVLTQTWLSHKRFLLSVEDFKLAEELYSVNRKLNELTEKAQKARVRSQLDVIFMRTQTLMARMVRENSYAEVRAAFAQVYHSIGLDLLPENLTIHEIMTSDETEKYMDPADNPTLIEDLPTLIKEIDKKR
ncbi:MAG: transporter [Gammaproteobacteria bacterium]|nr:MAG: transporter [Gammaproteobacteria bacterium]